MAYHSGISPPTDPSSEDRSRTGDEGRRAPGRVPAAMSIVRSISERPQQQGRRSNQSTTPEDVSVVVASRAAALRRGRTSQQGTHGDRFWERSQHSSSTARDANMGPELNSQQATFLAGASAAQAYHASSIAEQATQMADHFQRETHAIRDMAHQREVQLTQVAAGLRNEAQEYVRREVTQREQELLRERALLQSQLEQALAARTEMLEVQAHREISNRTQRVELEAQQWASNTTAQHRADLEQLRAQARAEIAEVQRNRDNEIQRLERSFAQQLASQSNVDAVHVPIPKTGSGLSAPQTHHHINPFGTPNSAIDEGRHPLSIPVSFRPDPNVGYDAPPGLSHPQTPPPLPSSPPSIVLSQLATPKAQQASSSVTGQQGAEGRRPIFGAEGVESVLKDVSKDEKGFAFMSAIVKVLGETLDQTSASASQQDQDRMAHLFKSKMENEMIQLRQAYPSATSSACVPIAAPKAPPYLEGAAVSAPPPMGILPAGMPPLPIQGNASPVRGRQSSQYQQQGIRGRSGSSESSSPSPRTPPPNVSPYNFNNSTASSGLLPVGATCRVCGGQHDEVDCPQLTMNQPQPPDAATSSHAGVGTRNYADEEDDTIRVKSLSDLTLPHPPKDAAQARGYVNQVLMSIGKLQKTHGHEVYAWAQECLTHDEAILKADPRFPRTDRELAAKLIKTCRTGRFGILFQQMVESERAESGGMPCGRVMLRLIFKHFQLERDRIGMLGERNLLQLKVPGKNVSDLEAFKQKYDYILQTIPHADLPREQTLFNHLIDELEKSPIMAYKVQKAREAPLGSHRRTTAWLWEKVDLAIELEQQKKNRADFDRQLQLKPQDGYSGTAEVPGAPAPTGAAKTKKEKAAEKAERDRKEKEMKDKEKKKKEKEAAKAAALAAAAAGRPNPKGGPKPPPKAPKPPRGDTTPRGQEVTKATQMTPAEKAKTPCMFYAYGVCKAKSCAFLHSDTQKYKGPPPRVLAKARKGKAPAKVAASVAPLVTAPLSHSSTDVPQVNALPIQLDRKVPWLWDTAAGRHIIGRQALSSDMKSCLRKSVSPVAFATGGGSQPGQESLGFTGSKILEGEEVYVLKECPPAQSIGKTVVDKGYLFVWDPSESVPYLVAPQDIKRCRLRVPRNARICASRVVEYVPQYDETIEPVAFNQGSRMVPTPTAIPAESEEVPKDSPPVVEEYKVPSSAKEMPLDEDVSPSIADADGPNIEDVAEVGEVSEPSGSKEGGAASGAPGDKGHPLDDVPLADLADGEPLKDDVLKKEAESLEHMLTHFPKNPFCRICNVAKNTSRNVARKPDSKDDGFIDPPKEVFEQLATDDVILAKGSEHTGVGIGGIRSHHVIRDVKSGARLAYPLSKRDAQAHARNFRHFIGLKANEVTAKTLTKMDEAGELEQAAHLCGMTPETSMPNRWPHNAVLERDVREEKECCRSVHLQSGLPYEFHTFSYPYACLSMTFDRKALADAFKTQWEMITKSPFEGRRLCFGQLVFFRKKSATRRTLEPNMSPGLFLGWRIDPGLRYRGVLRVLDYQEYRTKKNALAVDVPQEELFVEPGPPCFPIAFARDKALREGRDSSVSEFPEIDLKELPFPPEGGVASPSTPSGPKGRGVYITLERIIRFKETPGCKGCAGTSSKHTQECRDRFARLVNAEKEEELASKVERAAVREHGAASSAPPEEEEHDEAISREVGDLFEAEGISHRPLEEASASALLAHQLKSMIVSGVATSPHSSSCTPIVELCSTHTPAFGGKCIPVCSAPTTTQRKANKNNRRKRKADQKSKVPGPKSTVFEFACAVDSQMGQTNEEMNINHIRLCREHINLCDEESCAQLDYQIRAAAESAPPHMWGALPCTSGSPWQYINSIRGGERFKVHLNKMILTSKKLFKSFVKRAELVLSLGGTVTFEWPRHNSGWNRPDVRRFFEQHPEFQSVEFDGCMLGLKSKDSRPIKKPWKLMTTDPRIKAAFQGYLCRHQPHEHDKCEGAETSRSAFYPQQMTMLIAKTWFPERFINRSPAMPCGVVSQPSEHREKEQELKHVSPLSGLETFAAELETDPTANNIVGQLLDVNTLLADSLKIQHPEPDSDINAMVTKLLSRSEMLASPEALSAVRKEAEGLENAGTWDLKSVREHADVRSEAKKTGISVHFGQLMTIASIKFFELAKHLQKMKGRIVYRGDCAKDEHGSAAVYQELGANPTSVQGLNACVAYGSLPGNCSTAADAIKAYVQAYLKGKHKTWIELPPELRPAWWKTKFVKPVVLLIKALYGHPDAGGLWEAHLKRVLHNLRGSEVVEFPGNFYFPDTKLLLSTYVDDLTLAGPIDQHQPFWEKLTSLVDVEPPEPIYRVLGRNHSIVDLPWQQVAAEGSNSDSFKPTPNKPISHMVFDMYDYALQTVELYKSITGIDKIKPAATPFVPEGSILEQDEVSRGELAPHACKILMKALWLGRLARPDIVKPINDLATKVQSWTRGEDKKLLRLIQYIHATPHYRLAGSINEKEEDLELQLYVDADFAGDKENARSTSGGFLVLRGPTSFFPLAWVSKRQTSTSRSTTESEVISLPYSLYQEGILSLQLWELLLQRSVKLRVMEDNQATILVVKKGYSPKLRHITRTHKVNLSCLSEVFAEGGVTIEYVDTKDQAADIFTKALPPQKWGAALSLLGMRTELPEDLSALASSKK